MATSAYDPRHEELVRRIRAHRLRLGLTQEDVAAYLEVPQSVVSRLEAGQRKISALEARDLAEWFGVDADELIPGRGWNGKSKRRR